jgi:phospholipid transport system substrate-binding protein
MIKALVAWLLMAAAVPPATPLVFVQRSVEEVTAIVHRLTARNPVKVDQQCAALRKAADHLFDFEESARRVLAPYWDTRSPKERGEFVRLFGDLLQAAYVEQLGRWSSGRMVYLAESVHRDLAAVTAEVVRERRSAAAVEYRLVRSDRGWAVYDVHLDGLSLVETYRERFDRIMQGESFARLIQTIRTMRRQRATEMPAVAGCALRAA